jgi:hypothetical protein
MQTERVLVRMDEMRKDNLPLGGSKDPSSWCSEVRRRDSASEQCNLTLSRPSALGIK